MATEIIGRLKTVSVTTAVPAAGDYAAEDVIGDDVSTGSAWVFAGIFRGNGTKGYITKVEASWETTGLTPRLAIFVYNDEPTCTLEDNAANNGVLNADIAKHQGTINMPAMTDLGGNSESIATPNTPNSKIPLEVEAAADADDLYIVVATPDAITGETATDDLTIKITVEQY